MAAIARDLGVSEPDLHRWMAQSDVDDATVDEISRDERAELVFRVARTESGRWATSWVFGSRLQEVALMGSLGRGAPADDNALRESFVGSMQIELLDRRACANRTELANAAF